MNDNRPETQRATSPSAYVINAEDPAEIARVLYQHRLVTDNMGGPFPGEIDNSTLQRVLEIGCGPGGWVVDVAFHHQKAEVVGIDISPGMIAYAESYAKGQGVDNTRFMVHDARQTLPFEDNSFDYVQCRFLIGSFNVDEWKRLVQECQRVLRPHGHICLTETDNIAGINNSDALKRMQELSVAVSRRARRAFFAEGSELGINPGLGRLLRQFGFLRVHQKAYVIDWSADAEAHESWSQNMILFANLGRGFLTKSGLISEEDYEQLYSQAVADMMSDDFQSITYLASTIAEKAEA
jgi:ubiquinone/menaquinone biosynthesis C-methylase UbiE